MRIVTLNIPQAYIDAIAVLITRGIYPSRSEAVRVALRKFLKKELEMVEVLLALNEKEKQIKVEPEKKPINKVIDMRSFRGGWPKEK